MNILVVAYYYPPINSAGSVRPLQMAHWLKRFGHTVHVLTCTYEQKKIFFDEIMRIPDPAYTRDHHGKRFWKWLHWRGIAEAQNWFGLYASVFSPWKKAVLTNVDEISRRIRPDLILATYPPLEVLEIGLELSRRLQVPLVSDFRDGLLFRAIEEKRLRSHFCIRKRYKKIEATVASDSILLIAVTPTLQKYFRERYPECRCEVVYNGHNPQELPTPFSFSLPSGFIHIVHTGRLALCDSAVDVRPFLAALHRISQAGVQHSLHLHLVGEYSKHERRWMGKSLKTGIVTIHPLVERQQAIAFQKSADLLLLITRPGVRSGIPLKLFEYMLSAKPVIALSDDMEIRRLVEESGCGWCVSPLDEPAITRLLTRILTDPAFQTSLERRPAVIDGFSWERQMGELNRVLTSLPPGSRRS